MAVNTTDKVMLGAAGLLFLGACAWGFMQQAQVAGSGSRMGVPTDGIPFESPDVTTTLEEARNWPAPAALTRGNEWLYDVFTPPEIFYDNQTRRFTVTPPVLVAPVTQEPVDEVRRDFGVTLVKVEAAPFRLQLVGYVGEGATARGTFQNMSNSETVIAGPGRVFESLNLEVVSFSVREIRTPVPGRTDSRRIVAEAVVRDTSSGESTSLSSDLGIVPGRAVADFTIVSTGEVRQVRVGDSFDADGATFTLDQVDLAAKTATVTKKLEEETETLTLNLPPPVPVAPVEMMPYDMDGEFPVGLPFGM